MCKCMVVLHSEGFCSLAGMLYSEFPPRVSRYKTGWNQILSEMSDEYGAHGAHFSPLVTHCERDALLCRRYPILLLQR